MSINRNWTIVWQHAFTSIAPYAATAVAVAAKSLKQPKLLSMVTTRYCQRFPFGLMLFVIQNSFDHSLWVWDVLMHHFFLSYLYGQHYNIVILVCAASTNACIYNTLCGPVVEMRCNPIPTKPFHSTQFTWYGNSPIASRSLSPTSFIHPAHWCDAVLSTYHTKPNQIDFNSYLKSRCFLLRCFFFG